MPGRFLIAVDLKNLEDGLDLKTVSYLNNVHLTIDSDIFEEALNFVKHESKQFASYVDCSAVENLDDIVALLDAGAAKTFVGESTWKTIIERNLLQEHDLERLVVTFDISDHDQPEQQADYILDTVRRFSRNGPIFAKLSSCNDKRLYDVLRQNPKTEDCLQLYVSLLRSQVRDDYASIVQKGDVAIIPATSLTTGSRTGRDLLPVHFPITAVIHSDRQDGLFPTVVTNEHGICLGLVYSSHESIGVALQTGCGVYYSRSRKRLWVKGKESGNAQELISIVMDCDADALQFKVRQKGEGTLPLRLQ